MGKGLIVVYFCGSRTGLKRVMILYDSKYEAWLKINHPNAVYMCIDKCVSTVLLLETLLFKYMHSLFIWQAVKWPSLHAWWWWSICWLWKAEVTVELLLWWNRPTGSTSDSTTISEPHLPHFCSQDSICRFYLQWIMDSTNNNRQLISWSTVAIFRDGPVYHALTTTLKVHKCHVRKVCFRSFASLYEPYQSFSSAFMNNRSTRPAGR